MCTPYRNKSTPGAVNTVCKDVVKTPENSTQIISAVTYVSPFVTFSRGKSSARKEYQDRHSQGGNNYFKDKIYFSF